MDLDRFLSQRQGAWRRLEALLQQVERSGLETLSVEQLRDAGSLYRRACSDLIYARTVLQNDELADFLNGLVGNAYAAIYRKAWFTPRAALEWLARGLPACARRNLKAILASWVFLAGGIAAGFVATARDREAFYYIVPTPYHGLYGHKQDDLREKRFGEMSATKSKDFAAMLFTHNTRVAFMTFAVGPSWGTLTAVSLAYNGALLGSIAANFHRFQQDLEFWAVIVPHGAVELSCIVMAGAAGLLLGWALIRPGRRSRGEAFAAAGKEALPLAMGAAPFLVVAGILEAFVAPSSMVSPWAKIAIGVVTGAALWLHLLVPRRARG